MSDFALLDVYLHQRKIGTITHLPGDRNLFTFSDEFINDPNRAMLSLSFQDKLGDLITDTPTTRTRLPPFFSNLLPEGHMRDYLAAQAGVNSTGEFYLLAALGKDLSGAVFIHPPEGLRKLNTDMEKVVDIDNKEGVYHFSLAGLQLKFSAIWEKENGLMIPVEGVGGSWIVKLPSAVYADVPENEYVMMELARRIGIEVPETALLPMNEIQGLPSGINLEKGQAVIAKRFDRSASGERIHIEDFAQVFGVFPEKKYQAASYRNIAEVIQFAIGEQGIVEFIRRFVFNALIGNGDMHLKNWSLIYRDKRSPSLAPAYDFVSTIPYLPSDRLALTFVDSKEFTSLNYEQFKRFSAKAKLSETLVLETVYQTVKDFKRVWSSIADFPLKHQFVESLNNHMKSVPIFAA